MRSQFLKQKLRRLFLLQVVLTLGIALLALWISGLKSAYSAGLGGLVCMLPNVLFANQMFKYQGARSANKIVNSFYKGEAIKILLSVVLFALVFIMFEITPLLFFITYIVVQMTFWVAPWIIINN